MNRKYLPHWLAAGVALAAVTLLCAQAPLRESKDGRIRAFWECELPAGRYLLPLDRIVNVSTHEYLVQGAGRVWEMVVADESSAVARFYYMEPASKLANPVTGDQSAKFTDTALNEVAKTTDSEEVWRRVVKEYPHATHAHTVEYRLADRETLERLYKHLEDCWTTGRAGKVKIPGKSEEP